MVSLSLVFCKYNTTEGGISGALRAGFLNELNKMSDDWEQKGNHEQCLTHPTEGQAEA